MDKIYIGMPCAYGRPRVEAMASFLGSVSYLTKRGYDLAIATTASNTWIEYARNNFCNESLKWGSKWTVMIDDDMGFPYDIIEKLIDNDVDICVPLMHARRQPFFPVIFDYIPPNESAGKFRGEYRSRKNLKVGLTECDGVGFGMVAIRTEILKTLNKPWFKVTEDFGEDLFFCTNARNHGFKIYYDGRLQINHYGDPLEVNTNMVLRIDGCPYTLEKSNA